KPLRAFPNDFRWQGLFQRSIEPLFLLNRRRRILFVNKAWENLTRVSAVEARGLSCTRRTASADDPWDLIVRSLCCPPPETLSGKSARTRRLVPGAEMGQRWWSLEFFPLKDDAGLLCILGKITVSAPDQCSPGPSIPEKLVALRAARSGRYCFDQMGSKLPALHPVLDQARLAFASGVHLLIQAHPGTGKEWLARTIHYESDCRDQAFIAVDCQRMPVRALDAVIFGPSPHEDGLRQRCLYLREPAFLPRDFQ